MSDAPMLRAPSGAKIRDELAELVRRDLVGPTDPTEEITGPPGGRQVALREKYPVGCLAPAGLLTNPAALDGLAEEGEASGDDDRGVEAVPAVPSFYPSSMGLSFAVSTRHIELLVEAKWGRYLRDHASTPLDDGSQPMVWRRQQRGGRERVTLVEGEIKPFPIDAEQPEVMVRGRVRRHDGQWIVSLFLVNTTDPTGKMMNATWIFQAELEVRGVEKGSTPFCPRELPLPDEHVADPTVRELRTLAMRYRHAPAFAVGHGVGVLVETLPDAPNRALSIRTEAMPWYEMPATDATRPSDEELLAGVELDMATLAEADRESLRHALEPIVVAYQKWILDRSEEVGSDPSLDRFRVDAELALDECRRAADRIREGIQVLLDPEDPEPLAAFRFANRAMRLQRLHTMAAAARRADPNLSLEDAVAAAEAGQRPEWRLFQLAFLLMGLPALADPTHPNRRAESGLADLLWFPTGGGKTEAYLGLAAFAMGIRRRKQSFGGFYAEDGVAVLMRYTLRLLTVQQFQRAAALICACESLRREDPAQWGDTTFRLGLWVGGSVTPNRTEDAETAVKEARGQLKGRPGGGKGSPHQLTNCPWCGTMLMPDQNVEVDTVRGRTVVFCGDRTGRCPFTLRRSPGEGLPVLVVDEEIYRLLPAFVIATVDKFAQLPWRGSVQALFGKVTGWCSRHGYRTPETPGCDSLEHRPSGRHPAARVEPVGALRPPDLIVQDELHLISGPLGSLVGLYETVVDELATWCPDLPEAAPVRPMVIASTATVRGAEAQVNGVFTRKLAIFPPPGTDSRNSFFARTRPTDELPGRRYVGVCAHGRKFKSLLIRLYVAGMAAAQLLHERYGGQAATDAYMTMVGYFGSLRELGGMRRMVDDDVATRLYDGRQLGLARREKPDVAELTSRLHSSEIPEILRRLEVPVPIARDPKGTDVYPVDVLLATNMISVGVDISRLGLMVVAGQPKSAAEYIQATSRVGRAAPGLVFTAFNWARPRDLSHYETFEHFHGSAYRHVEALSVTPFADRALDRGLTAVLASLVRQHDATWNANRDAERVDRHAPEVSELVAAVVDRAAVVTGDPSVAKLVRARLDRSLDRWAERAATMYQQLGYRGVADGRTVGLLTEPDTGQWTEWTCPTSLRNVEPGIRLLIREGSEPLGKERENPYRRPTDQAPTLLDTASFEPDDESNEEKPE